jgi:hypothetical protein
MDRPSDLTRYAQLIESMIPAPSAFQPVAEGPSQIQVERGLHLSMIQLREMQPIQENQPIQVVDAAGHARPVYRSLLVYSWLLAAEKAGDLSFPSVNAWIDSLDDGIFSALVHATAGIIFQNQTWKALADRSFGRLIDRQQSSGAFLPEDAKANPETRWYDELIALHAIASYAVRANDRRAKKAAQRSALFHQNETQPDHASAQPWGLLAFVRAVSPASPCCC